ncbi:multiheme c-type cytochrome [Sulfurimonas sp. HSL3-7]|uniref:multiheme c-type cytochrome n=1 Tax=Sulfonitrofixus jiaomeiensis TaxID=3131938 RepID=UPI0031FA48CF
MKKIYLLLLLSTVLFGNNSAHTFAKSEDCKACHTQIYNEFYGSVHANSTPQKDVIHNAVWAKHPQNKKLQQYGCGKCHTPAADDLDKMISKGQKVMPDPDNVTHQEGISCAYCHRIESIALHKKSNINIISKEEKKYFGTLKAHVASPYHAIATEGNDHMKNGNVCIGCHSHKMNKWGLNVCSTNIANEMDGANCVSCHMPKVDGSVSAFQDTKKHAFHGFAGAHFHSDMLEKYIDISMLRNIDNFIVNIDNRTSHALLLHPLRLALLKVSVTREGKSIPLKDETFVRVIGKNGKPAMPWAADTTIKDTMIQANEKRSVTYDFQLRKGDKVDLVLGYYLVNPKAVASLHLDDDKVATAFHILKKADFSF